jgi:quinoprotein glucose dehydrogenase
MNMVVFARRLGPSAALAALLVQAATLEAQNPEFGLQPPIMGELPVVPETYHLVPAGIAVTPYATGLGIIWSLEFAPDGRLFIAEREGRVRVISRTGQLDPEPWVTLPTQIRLEDGLLGMTLDPDFANRPYVYVFHTARKGDALVNQVVRFREVNGRGTDPTVILDNLRSFRIHNGGRLRFGPDGMLYVTTGETADPMRAQDLRYTAGKVLRINKDGTIPSDNPFPNSAIWAYGLRNPHGLAFRLSDGALFLSDNGPTGEWGAVVRVGARDELNLIRKGMNYGWPMVVGAPGGNLRYEDPLLAWNPSNPPGDLTFYNGTLMPQFRGDLFYSSLAGQALLRIRFEDANSPNRPTSVERWFRADVRGQSTYGRLRGMTVGPDGALYVGTSNSDRGGARPGDDKILRIAPAN